MPGRPPPGGGGTPPPSQLGPFVLHALVSVVCGFLGAALFISMMLAE